MDILVTYDIATADRAGERRLARVAQTCEGYGIRVQKSVFECSITPAAHQQLIVDLTDLLDMTADSVNLYRFPGNLATARLSLGRPSGYTPNGPWIV